MEENTKKIFVPKKGTKKEKAWGLFKENYAPKKVSEEIGVALTTAKTWYNIYKKQNK